MKLTVSQARSQLGQLVTHAQDPRSVIVLMRHGKPIAALVSMTEVRRIWSAQDDAWVGRPNPLTGRRMGPTLKVSGDLVMGPDGTPVTREHAAQIVHSRQMARADERKMLAAGGLSPVEGGELVGEMVGETTERLPWWRRLLSSGA